MTNQFLFGAFAAITIVFFVHNWLMSSRQQRLERKLEELRAQVPPTVSVDTDKPSVI